MTWRESARALKRGLYLLRRFCQNSVQRVHILKYETIWESFPQKDPPRIIVEIGSFDGLDALELGRMFPAARVYAFEVDPHNFEVVKKNTSIRKQITPIPQAVLDFTGQGVYHASDGDSSASGSMLEPRPIFTESFSHISFSRHFLVDTTTLPDWARQNNVDRIDLIWMDAQGAELRILKRMGNMLRQVRVLLLEVWGHPYYESSGTLTEIQTYLRDFGFYQSHVWMDGDAGDALFQKVDK